MNFDMTYCRKIAHDLFNTHSPSGYTQDAIAYVQSLLVEMGYEFHLTNKGNLIVSVSGVDNTKTVATSAHIDTLGLMVRSIKANGMLAVTRVGGPIVPTLDGEYCIVQTRDGKRFSGTILSISPSGHVFADASSKTRDIDTVEVRLDEIVKSADDVKKLGIDNGDFVFIDPKFVITPSGFLKSRFIDDKGSVCCLLTVLQALKQQHLTPRFRTLFYFVVHEEVGHGASAISDDIAEFVTVDMGCVGLDLAGNEHAVSIAAKDSGGPYDYELTSRLIKLAQLQKINYVVDIFPFYGSDVGAAWRAGHDCKGALIGPGVHASHGMERTHLNALEQTMKLLMSYLLEG